MRAWCSRVGSRFDWVGDASLEMETSAEEVSAPSNLKASVSAVPCQGSRNQWMSEAPTVEEDVESPVIRKDPINLS